MNYKPLDKFNWDDFEQLFGSKGACGGCWCMYWRLKNKDFESGKGLTNKTRMYDLVNSEISPGIIGYIDDIPIAWCSVAPREDFPRLENSRILKPVDDFPVWSIVCLFIHKNYRRKGFSTEIIKSAVIYAQNQGAKIIEAYPHDTKGKANPDPFVWTGIVSSFLKAGFIEVSRRSEKRPIMRFHVD